MIGPYTSCAAAYHGGVCNQMEQSLKAAHIAFYLFLAPSLERKGGNFLEIVGAAPR